MKIIRYTQLTPKMRQIVAAKSVGEGMKKVGSTFRKSNRIGYYLPVLGRNKALQKLIAR